MSDPNQPATATTLTVSNSDALNAALKGAHAGDTILLAPGAYAPISLNGLKFDGMVTIQSADSAHEAVLTGLQINNSAGLSFNNLDVPVAGYASTGLSISGSSNISLSGLTVHGTSGSDVGLGVFVRDSTGVTVTDSDFTKIGSGIAHLTSHNITFANNSFHDLETDGIVGGGSTGVTIKGNHFETFHPQPGDHPDAIQFFGASGVSGNDVTIVDNVIVRGAGEVYQGIFIENTDNVTIDGNAMAGTMFNGISVSGTNNASISDNFVQGFTDMGSRIIVRGQSSNVTVTHNEAQSVVDYHDNGLANPNYVASDNSTVAAANPSDLSTLNAWLSEHAQAVVAPVTNLVTSVVDQGVAPNLPLAPPNLPTGVSPMNVFGQGPNLTAAVDHSIHDMIANQIASSTTFGWIML